jgi:hypothetical protein
MSIDPAFTPRRAQRSNLAAIDFRDVPWFNTVGGVRRYEMSRSTAGNLEGKPPNLRRDAQVLSR